MSQDKSAAERLGPKVLITDTTRWPSPARMAIGLAKAGCRIDAICPMRGHPLLSTSVVEKVFPYGSLRPLESLAAAIEESKPQIILPCDDRSVEHLHELHAAVWQQGTFPSSIAGLIEYSLGAADSYPIVSCRWELLRIAKDEGLRVPDFVLLKSPEDLEAWKSKHPLPWVLKGDGTFGGRGVRIAQSRESAGSLFKEIASLFVASRAIKRAIVNRDPFWLRPWWNKRKPAVIVQSYIEGHPANCTFFCWKGELRAFIGVEVLSADGQTGPASVVRVVENSEMVMAAKRIASRLNLSGLFGLDFMIERDTRATYLIEMNPRCTPLSHLQLGKGRDLVEALAAALVGRPAAEMPAVTNNVLIAYFPQAWQSKSQHLNSSFQDIPAGEPALVDALLRPWPDRSILYRLATKLSGISALTGHSSDQGVKHA